MWDDSALDRLTGSIGTAHSNHVVCLHLCAPGLGFSSIILSLNSYLKPFLSPLGAQSNPSTHAMKLVIL